MIRIPLILAALLTVAGCSSSDPIAPDSPVPTPAPPPTAKVSFSDFVTTEIGNTSDSREPVEITDLDFEFADDPDAFEGLFPTGG